MPFCMLGKTSEREWISDLLNFGRLRMSKLSVFRKIESKAQGDPNEGQLMHFAGANPHLKITMKTTDGVELPAEGIVKLTVDSPDRNLGVYCMTGFQTKGDGTVNLGESVAPVVRGGRMDDFGDHLALFKNSPEFVRRFKRAAHQAGFEVSFGMVDYHPADYCGDVTPWDKIGDYAYQQEWRFVTMDPIPDDHLVLELGPLTDIGLGYDLRIAAA
jgi:hypothetical protein